MARPPPTRMNSASSTLATTTHRLTVEYNAGYIRSLRAGARTGRSSGAGAPPQGDHHEPRDLGIRRHLDHHEVPGADVGQGDRDLSERAPEISRRRGALRLQHARVRRHLHPDRPPLTVL